MKRLADNFLHYWRSDKRRKPLIVRGARQVGKTWSIQQFGSREFKSVVKIDFEKRPSARSIFDGDLVPLLLIEQLELVTGQAIRPGETLLFLDEIQACPRAITALRYFYEDMPDLHVVAAGSLLEFALAEASVPVGRVSYLDMHPLTFQEYLLGIGNEPAADLIGRGANEISPAAHNDLLDALQRYWFVGGMPECVKTVAEGGTLLDVFSIQDDILAAYRDDFAKYAGRADRNCLDAVLLQVARQVGSQLKYTRLNSDHSGPTNRKAFELLCQARLLHKIPSANPPTMPLGSTANPKRFKASLLDVGLMQRLCGMPADRVMQDHKGMDRYRGQLAEQFVAQELLVSQHRGLYYWAREAHGSQAEVDYLVAREGRVHPVEVKSGKSGQLRSMHLFLDTYQESGEGYVLYSGLPGRRPEQRLEFVPLYFAGLVGATDGRAMGPDRSDPL